MIRPIFFLSFWTNIQRYIGRVAIYRLVITIENINKIKKLPFFSFFFLLIPINLKSLIPEPIYINIIELHFLIRP